MGHPGRTLASGYIAQQDGKHSLVRWSRTVFCTGAVRAGQSEQKSTKGYHNPSINRTFGPYAKGQRQRGCWQGWAFRVFPPSCSCLDPNFPRAPLFQAVWPISCSCANTGGEQDTTQSYQPSFYSLIQVPGEQPFKGGAATDAAKRGCKLFTVYS